MKRIFTFFILITLCVYILPFSVVNANSNDSITVVFTHDLHSHLNSFSHNGEMVGGFAKIKTVINEARNSSTNSVVVDAGDFSMGTLFQSAYTSDAIEYRMMGLLGYDAISFGNHEFDYGLNSLKEMINVANEKSEIELPPILCANINTSNDNISEKELNSINIYRYKIIKTPDYTIAVFGLMGKDAAELSTSDEWYFDDYIQSANSVVEEIYSLHSPDAVICISHSGTGESIGDEDIELAKQVDGIDVIVSGHTHTVLEKPIVVNNTIIASCGEYGKYVGTLSFNPNEESQKLLSYELIKIDNTISEDVIVSEAINEFSLNVNEYLAHFGYESSEQIIGYSEFDFPPQSAMSDQVSEQQLGNLISDSYIHAIKTAEDSDYINVDVAVVPVGVIRDSIEKGNITVSDVYEISSLGIGNDGLSGYPLCSVYLYGSELWTLAEIDASVSGIMSYAQLYCSGLGYSVNKNRMFLNRVYDCWIIDSNGNRVEIENDKLYRVVSGITSAKMLGTVKDKSFGLLELTPKDANGNEITDFNSCIATDSNNNEIKEWKALADYISSFPKGEDGIAVIPSRYAKTEGRKNFYTTFEFSQMFIHWTGISWCVFALVIIFVLLIVFAIFKIYKIIRKRQRTDFFVEVEDD